jgi:hypothetical protein
VPVVVVVGVADARVGHLDQRAQDAIALSA